jgi:hypothetical protein
VEAFCCVALESVTENVTKYAPAWLVVPLMAPVVVLKLKPLRGKPVMFHVKGDWPPVMAGVKL